ncbi:hypothetical protein [Ferrimonas marina]|uniref:DoxX-like family protein n=1 Tax=Ferrimonas marina TaxID=299255 RepID=A0A1M5YC46_9GAMM|nr:hypothetical protein [Ferrimonas marina]SHI09418.1 hypothetical protein SAMN02745129_4052 [Ferrimonas marina]
MNQSMNQTMSHRTTPWHLWVVGVLALFWNAMGAMDYYMTQTRNPEYMANFTEQQLAFFYGFPAWADACWAIAVWGGVLGAVMLLLRKGSAVPIFLVSLLCMVIVTFQNYVLSNGMEIIGDVFSLGFTLLIFLVALALYLYAKRCREQGILH